MSEKRLKSRLFGANVSRTVLRLVVASLIVGAIFSFIGMSPKAFWSGLINQAQKIVAALGDSFAEIMTTLASYLLIGAAIVVPIWLITRIFASRR